MLDRSARSSMDYAQLIKIYGTDAEAERRYSPVVCQSCVVREVQGDPDPKRISTSYIERQNLTMRMSMRRYTRLTNGFSLKLENHAAATAIHFMHYNFARIHGTVGCRRHCRVLGTCGPIRPRRRPGKRHRRLIAPRRCVAG